ncbi:bifunctional glycoside hydrolase 114/ polysaccharide deacetylase family protein [Hydrogenophaga sp.]|uniref:bifunctional glycoside hydrolase 114/ polysaccharide deacetylase family protein n=1 Tax=Hydrogenophaga sp. TaxID=1904254 RepID=UPI0019CB4A68|nr:bifunctional glycoside hydrolase 114/ polysaccharide deacetylase family protein [Hydrogenophaga sp.]MBD3894149.1 hypothetical protein [Hydrogenophaga sp.]
MLLRQILLSLGLLLSPALWANPSVALFYGPQLPLGELRAFDIVVVEADHGHDPLRHKTPDSEWFAYVAVAEVHPSRAYFKDIPPSWHLARNSDWGSVVLDQTPAAWPDFFAERVIGPLWQRGYRGFFLDTLDSYRLAATFDEAAQQQGLVRVIETLHRRFPGIRLILNRGFEIVPQVADKVFMVAAESLYQRWNAAAQRYEEVSPADREWLLGQLNHIKNQHRIPILAIDYVPAADRQSTRQTAERLRAHGFIAWVSDHELGTLGIGQIELQPRRVALLYDGRDALMLNHVRAHRYLQMPFNHMGYVVDFFDVNLPLPTHILKDRYAGVATWLSGSLPQPAAAALAAWLEAQIAAGMPLAVLGSFGFPLDRDRAASLGLSAPPSPTGAVRIASVDPMLGFEAQPQVIRAHLQSVGLSDPRARALLEFRDQREQPFVGAALTPWGGFVLDPFVVLSLPGTEQSRWIVDPFAFLQSALRLEPLPAPDVTTENGRRLFFSHIDSDGFPSRAEFPGSPLAAEILLTEVLQRHRVPTTMSAIEAEVSPDGLFPELSPQLMALKRRMFALEHVEIATHTFSHPLFWDQAIWPKRTPPHNMHIPGYEFNLEREIVGSTQFIQRYLAPPGKPVKMILWSGDTAPTAEALEIAERAGLLNLNGGDTFITRSNPTLTAVGAHGIQKNGFLQVYAPITNENIYTNLWTGPFWGFSRAIETFEMTESPRRLKAVGIYYHTYSASKRASLNALHTLHAWAQAQELHPIFASEYARKVQDFHAMGIAREGEGWRVRSRGYLRTLRLPAALGVPDLSSALGVAGFSPGVEGTYVHLSGSSAWFRTQPAGTPAARAYLFDANGRLSNWQSDAQGQRLSFSLRAYEPLEFRLALAPRCRVTAQGRTLSPQQSQTIGGVAVQRFQLSDAAADIQINCP